MTAFCFLSLILICSASGLEQAKNVGIQTAQERGINPPNDPSQVPGYERKNHETIEEPALIERSQKTWMQSEMGNHLRKNAQERTRFSFTADDPLFQSAKDAQTNPHEVLKTEDLKAPQVVIEWRKQTCEEAAEPIEHTCEIKRHVTWKEPEVTTHDVTVNIYSHGWPFGLSRNIITGQKLDSSTTNTTGYSASTSLVNPFPSNLVNRIQKTEIIRNLSACSYNPKSYVLSVNTSGPISCRIGNFAWINGSVVIRVYFKPFMTEKDLTETLTSTCEPLEDQVTKGLCTLMGGEDTEGLAKKTFGEVTIERPWWKRKFTYKCSYASANTCSVLRSRGCQQINSTCKTMISGSCVEYKQTFQCPHQRQVIQNAIPKGNEIFCLGGDCRDASYDKNTDFAESITQLSTLREMNKTLSTFPEVQVFKGEGLQCKRNPVDFKDCCKNLKGWGVKFNLAQCTPDEQKLAKQRSQNLCVYIGTYCAKKTLGICVTKKMSFCCFPSKLSRILQEQGRAQLRMGWGDPKEPSCQGFNVDQMQSLQLDHINFRELFQDIYTSAKVPNTKALEKQLKDKVKDLSAQFKGKPS